MMLSDCFSFAPELSLSFCFTFWIKNGGLGRSGGLEFGCISPVTSIKTRKSTFHRNKATMKKNDRPHRLSRQQICIHLFNLITINTIKIVRCPFLDEIFFLFILPIAPDDTVCAWVCVCF